MDNYLFPICNPFFPSEYVLYTNIREVLNDIYCKFVFEGTKLNVAKRKLHYAT